MHLIRLTVFTPTYNRAHTLPRTYSSLCRQSSKEFKWVVIDDGPSDGTRNLVESWKEVDNGFEIEYYYKENGGLHTAYNKAIEVIDTELCVCIDSDDYIPDDAVEKILNCWEARGSGDVAGIVGLDFTVDGKPIGGYFPDGIDRLHIIDYSKYHHYGDVKVVHRTSLLKEVAPMPTFPGEKNFNPIYLFHKIDLKYPLLLLNDNLCYVDYQPDGMTSNIYRQYVDSPRSFSELRKLLMSRPDVSLGFRFRQCIHYVSSQIMANNKQWIKDSPCKLLTVLASPLGLLLFVYIKYRAKR